MESAYVDDDFDVRCSKHGMTYDNNSACRKCEDKGKPSCPFEWINKIEEN